MRIQRAGPRPTTGTGIAGDEAFTFLAHEADPPGYIGGRARDLKPARRLAARLRQSLAFGKQPGG